MPADYYRPRLRVLIDPVWIDRILAKTKIDPVTKCWNWTGALSDGRYPALTTSNPKKTHSVHRLSLAGKLGRELLPGMQACHTCDNDRCINPDHLYEGTQLDNMHDKLNRGRHPTRYASRMLSDDQVRQIRRLVMLGVSQYEAGRRYGISRSVVLGIINGSKYKDVA